MSGRRIGLCAALIVLALAPPAAAKEGTTARLTTDIPMDAAPGETFRIAWTLKQFENGRPFSALGVFVRLHGEDGASTTAIAAEQGPGSGVYVARATVPQGGIEWMQIGHGGGDEAFFEIENLPEGTAPADDPGGAGWTAPLIVIVGTAALVLLLRWLRPPAAVATR